MSTWDLGQGNREAGEGDASSAHKAAGVALSLDVGVARAAGAGGPSSSSRIPSSLQRKRFLGRVGRPLARSRSRLWRVWALPLPPGVSRPGVMPSSSGFWLHHPAKRSASAAHERQGPVVSVTQSGSLRQLVCES